MNSLVLLIVAACVLVQTHGFKLRPRLDGRIVGGQDANIKNYPYQLSLQSFGSHFCGASLIRTGNKIALTAAHCADAYSTNLNVLEGSSRLSSGGKTISVTRVYQHPLYDSATVDYDVSVLTLKTVPEIGISISLQPVNQLVPVDSMAVVTGWGALSEGGSSPNQLQKVIVARVSQAECNQKYGGNITDRMTCYGSAGKDTCQGDSGGPLVYNNNQVGVVSWGMGCALPTHPGVYTDISNVEINTFIVGVNKFLNR